MPDAGGAGAGKTAGAMGRPFGGGGTRMGADVPPAGREMQDKAAALAALLRGRRS
jgi:hypothetical protein